MALSIEVREIDDVVIIAASGHFSTEEGTLFQNTVRRYTDDGARNFILNLRDVLYIDSSGLGELTKTYTTLRKIEGQVVLINPSKMVKDLLEITQLSTVFQIFDKESSAIASLQISNHRNTTIG